MVNTPPIEKDELRHIQKVAESISMGAGKILLNYRGKAQITKSKKDALDIVTEADEASEKYILTELKKYFPTHGYLSEEKGEKKGDLRYRWIIDPLDGTKEYARGIAWFTVNLALEAESGEIIIGISHVPLLNEIYSAAKGIGAYKSGRRLRVSNTNSLKDSIVSFLMLRGSVAEEEFEMQWAKIGRIVKQVYRTRSFANDIQALLYVAAGAYQGFFAPIPFTKWWDIAAGILLIKEAGGEVTTTKNNPITEESFKKEGLLASNGKIHNELLKLIA